MLDMVGIVSAAKDTCCNYCVRAYIARTIFSHFFLYHGLIISYIVKSDGNQSSIKKWVLYTASTYSISFNNNTTAKSQPDYIHKGLPLVWLFIQSENSDALSKLFSIMKNIPTILRSYNRNADPIDVRYHTADNSSAIQSAVSTVFPMCRQGNCVVHVKTNLKKKVSQLGSTSTNHGKVVEKFRMVAPQSPSEVVFQAVSKCVLSYLRKFPNIEGVAKNIEDFYVKGLKGNWYHVASGKVSVVVISICFILECLRKHIYSQSCNAH